MKVGRMKVDAPKPAVAMADIAFNLLLFFVILAKTSDDTNVEWTAAKTDKLDKPELAKASVAVDKNNRLFLNGQQIALQQLAAALEKQLGTAPSGQRTVLLKIHHETQASLFEPIIEAVSQAGGDLMHVLDKKEGVR